MGNANPIGLRSCYDEGKRCAETLCFDYQHQYGIDVKVVRIFNTYGPNMHPNDGRVVSNFIIQVLNNQAITVYGTGTMMNTEKGFAGPVNLGNPGEFTIMGLAEKVMMLTRSKSPITYLPLPADDPRQRQPDITLASSKLIWQPVVNLDDGLEETIMYFKNRV